MPFEFASAARIVFGEGTVREVAPAAAAMGRRALVVTGARRERAAGLIAALEATGVGCVMLAVAGEPSVNVVREGATLARQRVRDSGGRGRRQCA
jgi:alcohol dehydrogenase class IV